MGIEALQEEIVAAMLEKHKVQQRLDDLRDVEYLYYIYADGSAVHGLRTMADLMRLLELGYVVEDTKRINGGYTVTPSGLAVLQSKGLV